MKTIIGLFIAGILSTFNYCQAQQRLTGLVWEDKAYDALPSLHSFSKLDDLPFDYSLRAYTPYPADQGQVGSCVGWATGYAAFSTWHAAKNKETNRQSITDNAFSALYIFNQIKISCSEGSRIPDAFGILQNQGDVKSSSFDKGNDCNKMPTEADKKAAADYRIKDFVKLFDTDASADDKISMVEWSIANNCPVVIGMKVTPSFHAIKPGQKKWIAQADDVANGGHAMCVIGYDKGIEEFEIMNSWGQEWGDKGYITVTYDDFAKYCKYGFSFTAKQQQQDDEQCENIEADFSLRILDGKDDNGNYLFKDKEVDFNETKGHYEMNNWNRRKIYQMLSSHISEGTYVYFLSLDVKNKLELHFPKGNYTEANPQLFSVNEVPLILDEDSDALIIPSENSGMKVMYAGTDYSCILYSYKEITDIGMRMKKMKDASGDFMQRLYAGFGDIMVDDENINYDADKMHIKAEICDEKRYVAPIIIAITANE